MAEGSGRARLAKAGAKGANGGEEEERTKNPRIDTKCLQTLVFTSPAHQRAPAAQPPHTQLTSSDTLDNNKTKKFPIKNV